MDSNEILESQYWEELLFAMDRKDDSSFRRYRRYNKSLEAMGEKLVERECFRRYIDDEIKAFEAIWGFIDIVENEKLLKALNNLQPLELQIVNLRFVHRMQVSEIAKEIDKGVSTVSERIGRIIRKLNSELER